jgi:hypothetical protein
MPGYNPPQQRENREEHAVIATEVPVATLRERHRSEDAEDNQYIDNQQYKLVEVGAAGVEYHFNLMCL